MAVPGQILRPRQVLNPKWPDPNEVGASPPNLFGKKYTKVNATIARQNGSHELANASLLNTIAFAEKNHGHMINPNAPHKSAKMHGKQKQAEMSTKANNISSFGYVIRSRQIQVTKPK